jgi:hypothetical protein
MVWVGLAFTQTSGSEALGFMESGQFIEEFVQVTVQQPGQVVGGKADAVVGDA